MLRKICVVYVCKFNFSSALIIYILTFRNIASHNDNDLLIFYLISSVMIRCIVLVRFCFEDKIIALYMEFRINLKIFYLK